MTAGQTTERNRREKELDLGLADMRRNPYLISTGQPTRRRPAGREAGNVRPISQNRKYAVNREYTTTGKPATDREYTATGKPVTTREHIATGKSAVTREHIANREPASNKAYITTGKPATNREPAANRKSAVNRKHAAARRRARLRKQRIRRLKFGILLALTGTMAVFAVVLAFKFFGKPDVDGSVMPGMTGVANALEDVFGEKVQGISASAYAKHPEWTEDFLTPNEFSRPGDSLGKVKNVFVHYTANPGTSAAQNRSYFEQLKDTQERSASAHFIIGYEGEIIQCVPLDEIAYAVQTRNMDSVSIECCYLAQDGSFTQETYDSLLALLRWLLDTYHLDETDILRHYDCGGKKCPLYYTEHEDAWEQLKRDVKSL